MVMATDMEEDGAMEGVDESEGEVDEFDLAELRREFAGQTEADEEAVERVTPTVTMGIPRGPVRRSRRALREGEPFGSDRERYQAVVRAAREHGLGIDDLEELERAESAEDVERRARGLAERRTLDRRVEALERQLAPVQQFDSNRASAPSSGSDEAWIDRYMAGDRSARAVAAARRAFD